MAIYRRKTNEGKTQYQVRVRDSIGRWFPAETFDRMEDAKRHERELLQRRDFGSVAMPARYRDLRLEEYWPIWAKECRGRVSEGWKRSQDQMARDYVLPWLGRLKLSDIRSHHIGQLLNQVRSLGLSAQSLAHVYNLIHKALGDAVEYFEILEKNPVLRRERPRVPRTERAFLNPADTWKLLDSCRNHFLGPAVWISALSGLRPGEVQALRAESVDYDRRLILIREAYKRKVRKIEPYPKQEDWGMAPMPDALIRYLRATRGNLAPDGFIAAGEQGRMLQYEVFLLGLRRLCQSAGVKSITPHELRHSCTELYVQAGASAEDIRRLLNQSSLSVTQRYIHRTDERLNAIAGRIEPVANT